MTNWASPPDSVDALLKAVAAAKLVDLTHPLKAGMPVWPSHPLFCQEVVESLERGDVSCFHALSMGEHTGTHFDAPSHFIGTPGGWSISEAPLEKFFGRMATIHTKGMAPRAAVEPEVVMAWEAKNGPIAKDDAVFFHFEWDRFWDDHPREFLADWPGLSSATCELLAARGVRIVGSDCLSIDCFGSSDFPAHHILLGAGILIGENFARLGILPPICYLATLPLPIVNGSGSPLRAIAFVQSAQCV
ncbi:cyclase family protein [Methylocapsa sp. S129]|uniref:cyclase family protein n=1 Tax=Methylocapsa sp. S129 TaxID=1641869 RepID=UPI00131C9C17|nr:cyclase family protein [Methylocapsa sp. S129]